VRHYAATVHDDLVLKPVYRGCSGSFENATLNLESGEIPQVREDCQPLPLPLRSPSLFNSYSVCLHSARFKSVQTVRTNTARHNKFVGSLFPHYFAGYA